jgi:hypothetical protein
VQAAVSDLIDAWLPRLLGVADAEGEVGQSGGLSLPGVEDDPPRPVGAWQIGFHATSEAGSITSLGIAGVQLAGCDAFPLEPQSRALGGAAACWGRVIDILGERFVAT